MENKEQALIFARKLRHYISLSGKTQKEVAKDLGFNQTTFNTWCVGKILPSLGKIQRIADYFKIGKSALLESDSTDDTPITSDELALIRAYRALSEDERNMVRRMLGIQEKGRDGQETGQFSA